MMEEANRDGSTLRLFVAIELPQGLKDRLSQVQTQLKAKGFGVRWVNPGGVHLTLKFLGYVSPPQIESIVEGLTRALADSVEFHLEMAGLGVFPSPRRPRVLWVGIKGDLAELNDLQRRIDVELAARGFSPEKRAFSPHLTLGRVDERVAPAERQEIGEAVEGTKVDNGGNFRIEAVCLMQSHLRPSGAVYECLRKFLLRPKG